MEKQEHPKVEQQQNPTSSGSGFQVAKVQQHICQCEKTYSTFSALNLHVKFKHDQNLQVSQTEGNYKMQEIDDRKIFTYNLTQTSFNKINEKLVPKAQKKMKQEGFELPKNLNRIEKVDHFLKYCSFQGKSLNPHFTTFQLILTGFKDYLEQIKQIEKKDDKITIPQDIVLLFNQFIVYYVPVSKKTPCLASFKKQTIIMVMFSFGKWLKKKDLTAYTIVLNENINFQGIS